MNIFDPLVSGSLSVSGSAQISGSLTVLGGINANLSGTTATASYVEYNNVANKPTLISGSSQISGLGYAITGSNTFNGNQIITGSAFITTRVGINDNTPSYPLDIDGSNETAVIGVKYPISVTSNAVTRIRIDSTQATPNSGFGLYSNGAQKWSIAMFGATSDFTLYNDALLASALLIKGNNSNVLIGTTTDAGTKLNVNGTINSSEYKVNNISALLHLSVYTVIRDKGERNAIVVGDANDPVNYFDNSEHIFRSRSGLSEYMRVNFNGNLGIGTSNPLTKLQLDSTSGTTLRVRTSTSGGAEPGIDFLHEGNDLYSIKGGSHLRFLGSGGAIEHMRIQFGGNVGIGTSSPGSLLHVLGPISLSAGSRNLKTWIGGAGSWGLNSFEELGVGYNGIRSVYDGSAWSMDFTSGSSESFVAGTQPVRMRITSGGNVLIGTTTDDGARLRVEGGVIRSLSTYNNTTATAANLVVSAGGTFERSTSSLKYKKDVRDYDKGLDVLMNMRPVYYKGKSENDGDTQFAGLIAEEVHDLGLTEFVQYANDGSPDALAYTHMNALLIKAIQELKSEIDILKNN